MRVLAVTLAALLSLSSGSAFARSDVMPAPKKAPREPVQQVTLYEAAPDYTPPPKPTGSLSNAIKVAAKTALSNDPNASKPVKQSAKEMAKESIAKANAKELAKQSIVGKEAKEFEGVAKALDGERLMIGEKEIRLFGIVTPGISSNYGPQARQKLDAIIKGAVLCKVTDKDKDGRPIAFCGTVDTPDLSYEMLRQGWAMVDRKALKNNSLAEVYEKVEQEAQSLNKGLFAPMPMVNSVPISNPSNTVTVPLVAPTTVQAAQAAAQPSSSSSAPITAQPITAMGAKVETIKGGSRPAERDPVARGEEPRTALSLIMPETTTATTATKPAEAPAAAPAPVTAKPTEAAPAPAATASSSSSSSPQGGFIERYQGIVGGVLWIFGALAFGLAAVIRDRMQLAEKRRALAAALNGELTSARHICRTRARELIRQRRLGEAENQPRPSQLWPRIRAVVYQAHVGSIGLLGSDLARRVASVYGQCADYAAYYQQTAMQRLPSGTAVSETLSTLADHIDNILDGLAQVEYTGRPFVAEIIEDVVATDDGSDQQPEPTAEQQQQTRNSVNEEAQIIKERFERMAASMVGMLGRKREPSVDPSVAPAENPAPAVAETATQEAPSEEAKPSQAA